MTESERGAFAEFTAIARRLEKDYGSPGGTDPWAGSPFAWIKSRPPAQKGAIGARLVSDWCRENGLDVRSAGDSQADRVVSGRRVEIKTSLLRAKGDFNFQQLRDQDYEFVVCLGLMPADVRLWIVPKQVMWTQTGGQHGGGEAAETHWLKFAADDPPEWLADHGGTLDAALAVLRRLTDTKSS